MKNILQTNPFLSKTIVLVTCFMLVMLYNKSKAADCNNTPFSTGNIAATK